MDAKDKELQAQESLQVNKEIRDNLKKSVIVPIPELPDVITAKISNEVKARLLDAVDLSELTVTQITNGFSQSLEAVTKSIAQEIAKSLPEPEKEIIVKNLGELKQDDIKVKNLDEISKSLNSNIDVLVQKIIDNPPIVNVEKQSIEWPMLAKKPIAVRLSDGKSFYNAMFSSGGGGGGSVITDTSGNAVTVTNNKLDVNATVNASIDTTGLATDTNQTNGSQKTQIVDAGGEVATVTGGKLDVNATASLSGDAIPASGATTAITTQIVDGSGNQITSFGGGTQYTEDAAAAANPVGTAINLIRDDNLSGSLTTTDGDNVAARGNNKGELYVKHTDSIPVTDNGGSLTVDGTVGVSGTVTVDASGTAVPITDNSGSLTVDNNGTFAVQADTELPSAALIADASAHPTAPTVGAIPLIRDRTAGNNNVASQVVNGTDSSGTGITAAGMLAQFDDTTPGTVTENRFGNVRMSVRREIYNQIRDAAGNERGANVDASGNLNVTLAGTGANSTAVKVDGSAVTQPISAVSLPSHDVTNAGTFATQATLQTGTNVVGKVGIDQTTPGTTNAVSATNLPTTVDTNSGNKSASTLRVVLATDQPALTNKLLVTPDANSAVNIAQLAGNTISSGVGTSGTGTLRTVEANDVGRTLQYKTGSVSSSGNNTIITAGSNKLKIYAFSLTTTSTTAVLCKFQSGASGTDLWGVYLQAPSSVSVGANLAVSPPGYIFATASATLLNLNLGSAQTVYYSVAYFDEA